MTRVAVTLLNLAVALFGFVTGNPIMMVVGLNGLLVIVVAVVLQRREVRTRGRGAS